MVREGFLEEAIQAGGRNGLCADADSWGSPPPNTTWRMMTKRKYALDIRWNCSYRFKGRKEKKLYLAVLMMLP